MAYSMTQDILPPEYLKTKLTVDEVSRIYNRDYNDHWLTNIILNDRRKAQLFVENFKKNYHYMFLPPYYIGIDVDRLDSAPNANDGHIVIAITSVRKDIVQWVRDYFDNDPTLCRDADSINFLTTFRPIPPLDVQSLIDNYLQNKPVVQPKKIDPIPERTYIHDPEHYEVLYERMIWFYENRSIRDDRSETVRKYNLKLDTLYDHMGEQHLEAYL